MSQRFENETLDDKLFCLNRIYEGIIDPLKKYEESKSNVMYRINDGILRERIFGSDIGEKGYIDIIRENINLKSARKSINLIKDILDNKESYIKEKKKVINKEEIIDLVSRSLYIISSFKNRNRFIEYINISKDYYKNLGLKGLYYLSKTINDGLEDIFEKASGNNFNYRDIDYKNLREILKILKSEDAIKTIGEYGNNVGNILKLSLSFGDLNLMFESLQVAKLFGKEGSNNVISYIEGAMEYAKTTESIVPKTEFIYRLLDIIKRGGINVINLLKYDEDIPKIIENNLDKLVKDNDSLILLILYLRFKYVINKIPPILESNIYNYSSILSSKLESKYKIIGRELSPMELLMLHMIIRSFRNLDKKKSSIENIIKEYIKRINYYEPQNKRYYKIYLENGFKYRVRTSEFIISGPLEIISEENPSIAIFYEYLSKGVKRSLEYTKSEIFQDIINKRRIIIGYTANDIPFAYLIGKREDNSMIIDYITGKDSINKNLHKDLYEMLLNDIIERANNYNVNKIKLLVTYNDRKSFAKNLISYIEEKYKDKYKIEEIKEGKNKYLVLYL